MKTAKWLWRLIVDVINEYRHDGVGDLAASITFWTLLSIPAAALALISALGTVESFVGADVAGDLRGTIDEFILDTFSNDAPLTEAVDDLFSNDQGNVLTFSVVFSFLTLSRGFAGLIRALDQAYNVEDGRAWWHVRIVAVGLGFGTVLVVAVGATFLALAPSLVLPSLLFDGSSRLLLIPVTMTLLFLWALTLFHIGPYHRTPLRFDVPGALFTAFGWLIVTQGFAIYVQLTSTGNSVQSSIGGLLLGITLMYALSVIMLVGAELNDVLVKRAGVSKRPTKLSDRVDMDEVKKRARRGLAWRDRPGGETGQTPGP